MKVSRHTVGNVHKPLPTVRVLEKIINTVLTTERKRLGGDLSVIFVDDKAIIGLNKKFLGENGTTDVIAFPYPTAPLSKTGFPFGDIYICTGEAHRNAIEFDETFDQEIRRLVIHGMLHLLGYDDHAPKDHKKMWAKQEKILGLIRV